VAVTSPGIDPGRRGILRGSGDAVALHRREVPGMLREVFRLGEDYVVKRYTCSQEPPGRRRPWAMEDRALLRLTGDGAPLAVGFLEERVAGGLIGTLVRHYVRGSPIGYPDATLVARMGELVASIHGRRVTPEDAHRENFILGQDGRLAFLDFGKARTFGRWDPLVYAGIAFDLHRLYRATLDRDESLWRCFLDAYFRATPYPAPARAVIRGLLATERRRYRFVKGR
jgi:tRNA A-37 threonylcarbamoyl transferase component Bud32